MNYSKYESLKADDTLMRLQRGVTLLETIVFIVVLAVALVAILRVFNFAVTRSVDPLIRIRAVEIAQAQLDEILSRRFDENSPIGGIPACDSSAGTACLGISPDSDYDDVGDYHNYTQNIGDGYVLTVRVVAETAAIRRVTVTVDLPDLSSRSGSSLVLSAYKVNF